MKLQKASLCALFAILELADEPGRFLSGAEIAEKYGVSPHHLAKVMRTLVRSGLVEAERGVGGGYCFVGNVNRITLLDVIQLFESVDTAWSWGVSTGGAASEEYRTAPVLAELQRIAGEIDVLTRAVLDTVTLKTALNSTAGCAGLTGIAASDADPTLSQKTFFLDQ